MLAHFVGQEGQHKRHERRKPWIRAESAGEYRFSAFWCDHACAARTPTARDGEVEGENGPSQQNRKQDTVFEHDTEFGAFLATIRVQLAHDRKRQEAGAGKGNRIPAVRRRETTLVRHKRRVPSCSGVDRRTLNQGYFERPYVSGSYTTARDD